MFSSAYNGVRPPQPPLPTTGAIAITHYINPHVFWFRYESEIINNEELTALETHIAKHIATTSSGDNIYRPRPNEIVAVMQLGKWIRAKVIQVTAATTGGTASPDHFTLWAIDHG